MARLIEEIPPDTELHFSGVDRVGIGGEEIPAPENVVEVLVFHEQVGSFDIQREEYVEFWVITCFLDILVVELHDTRVISIGIERGVIEQVYTELQTQYFFEQTILVIVVRVQGYLGELQYLVLVTDLVIHFLVKVEVPQFEDLFCPCREDH